ncbi:MAG: zinc ribbon domain-containing protein [Thermodesulfobacteriota bacterium]
MPKYSYFCKACAEPYEMRMSAEEKEGWVPSCPNCGDGAEGQELFGVAPDGAKRSKGGCCGSGGGCCG